MAFQEIPILTSDNWQSWNAAIRTHLSSKHLIHHIDTETGILDILDDFEEERPMSPSFLSTTPESPEQSLIQEDAIVRSLIYEHIDDYTMELFLCSESARDLYSDLESLFRLQIDSLLTTFFSNFKQKAAKGVLVRDVAEELNVLQDRIGRVDEDERPEDFLKLMVLLHMFDSEHSGLQRAVARIRSEGLGWDDGLQILRDEQVKCHQRRRSSSLKQQLWTFDGPSFPLAPKSQLV